MIDRRHFYRHVSSLLLVLLVAIAGRVHAADKLVGLHSAQVMFQLTPDASYQSEIPGLEQRLEIREAALQATFDEIAQTDPRAKSVKPQKLIDRRYLIELEKSGVCGK